MPDPRHRLGDHHGAEGGALAGGCEALIHVWPGRASRGSRGWVEGMSERGFDNAGGPQEAPEQEKGSLLVAARRGRDGMGHARRAGRHCMRGPGWCSLHPSGLPQLPSRGGTPAYPPTPAHLLQALPSPPLRSSHKPQATWQPQSTPQSALWPTHRSAARCLCTRSSCWGGLQHWCRTPPSGCAS